MQQPAIEKKLKLKPTEATAENFKEYGQVIEAWDGRKFGSEDAQLELNGIPRLYILPLHDCPPRFSKVTHHAKVTQCLGSIGGGDWYLAVAKPSMLDKEDGGGSAALKSRCGHFYLAPEVDEVRVFRFSGVKFVKLEKGTWHNGPLFNKPTMDFYNLELSDTNVADHTTYDFGKQNGVVFSIDE